MKNIKISEQQVKAYKNLIKMGALHEELIGLIDDESLDEIRRIVNEEENKQVEKTEYQEDEENEEYDQDEGYELNM